MFFMTVSVFRCVKGLYGISFGVPTRLHVQGDVGHLSGDEFSVPLQDGQDQQESSGYRYAHTGGDEGYSVALGDVTDITS